MTDLLVLSSHLPVVDLVPGDVVAREGGDGGGIWVLERGVLEVRKGDITVNTITEPGALIGEISTLIGSTHTATVVATSRTRLRYAADGDAFLAGDPRIMRVVAVGLARRLAFVTTYLADLRSQYGEAPGLAMVGDVLAQLAQRQGPLAMPGSRRDPDPEY